MAEVIFCTCNCQESIKEREKLREIKRERDRLTRVAIEKDLQLVNYSKKLYKVILIITKEVTTHQKGVKRTYDADQGERKPFGKPCHYWSGWTEVKNANYQLRQL